MLFIIADDMTTALGAYGRPVQTPNIDSIASRGMVFDNVYTQHPLCGPSRVALMTGLYPRSVGAVDLPSSNFRDRYPDLVTMPQLFRQNGYLSARVSKIYHMHIPNDIISGASGIDDPLSWDVAVNIQAPEANATGVYRDLSPKATGPGVDMITVESTEGALAHVDGRAAQKAVDWLRTRDKSQPFFLAVGMVRPHVPFVAPKEYFEMYPLEGIELPYVPSDDLDDIPAFARKETNARRYGMSDRQQREAIRGYYATVSYMDAQVGRVLDELDAQGLTENTIVVFTSDHGFNLGEHTTWQKRSLFEDTLRVPLVMAGPGIPHDRSSGIMEQIDIYPTIAELAGMAAPKYVHGKSFVELLTDPRAHNWQDEAAYAVTVNGGESVRNRTWRFNLWRNGDTELYNQETDPNEFTNLAHDPAHTSIAASMNQLLLEMRTVAASFGMEERVGHLDESGHVDADF